VEVPSNFFIGDIMKITLISSMPSSGNVETDEAWLGMIASQSRKEHPVPTKGLFNKTKDWGHESIQEFATYIFHVEDVSVNLLKQLTRHRIASYNVMSHRHVPPNKVIMPKDILYMDGNIYLKDGSYVEWNSTANGNFNANYIKSKPWQLKKLENCSVPLEDIRYGFPCGVSTNLFVQFNGRSLRNFLRLRTDSHAQWEIREMANVIKEIVAGIHPFMVDDI